MLTVRSIRARGRALLAEVVLVGLGLAAIFTAAIWLSRPMVDIRVDSADEQRYLLGFYDTEGAAGSAFRWSRTDATVRLYGFDQRAPVLVRARIGAGREPGQPPVQLTLGPEAPLTVALAPAWRSYALLVAPPPHDREGRLLALHSLVDPPYPD